MISTIYSALWVEPVQPKVALHASTEKILARVRWGAFAIFSCMMLLTPGLRADWWMHQFLLFGILYCTLGQYLAYRRIKGTHIHFPIGITDIAFVSLLCFSSGGFQSPFHLYFYGLTFIATMRFGWRPAFGIVLLAGLAYCILLSAAQPLTQAIPELYYSLGLRVLLLLGIASLAAFFARTVPKEHNTPKVISPEVSEPKTPPISEAQQILNIDSLLQSLADQVLHAVPCKGVCVVSINAENAPEVSVKTAGSFAPLPPGAWQQAMEEGGPIPAALALGPLAITTEQDIYKRLQSFSGRPLAQRQLLVHNIGSDRSRGCLVLSDRRNRDGFRQEDNQAIATTLREYVPAIDNARAYAKEERSTKELRGLIQSLLDSQEEERRRVVTEWHDRLGEKVFRVLHNFRGCQEFVLQNAPEGRERFEGLASELDEISVLVRQFADDLLPPVLENFGLVEALQSYVSGLQESEGFDIVMKAKNSDQGMSITTSRKLFRISQEALHNVQQHAKANHVQIALSFEQSGISLLIKDDGQGFRPTDTSRGGYGLLYMREQAVACGGHLTVESTEGEGTEVRVELPIDVNSEGSITSAGHH